MGVRNSAVITITTVLNDYQYQYSLDVTGDCPGFPMSDCLKSRGAFLGRKARMLSCQSEGRFEAVTSGSSLMSVFYRAILQVRLSSVRDSKWKFNDLH